MKINLTILLSCLILSTVQLLPPVCASFSCLFFLALLFKSLFLSFLVLSLSCTVLSYFVLPCLVFTLFSHILFCLCHSPCCLPDISSISSSILPSSTLYSALILCARWPVPRTMGVWPWLDALNHIIRSALLSSHCNFFFLLICCVAWLSVVLNGLVQVTVSYKTRISYKLRWNTLSCIPVGVTYIICALAPRKHVPVLVFCWAMGYMTGSHVYRLLQHHIPLFVCLSMFLYFICLFFSFL